MMDNSGPAFPTHAHPMSDDGQWMSGMSLRDYFAGQALNGMISGGFMPNPIRTLPSENTDRIPYDWAGKAYELADAMLKAREA